MCTTLFYHIHQSSLEKDDKKFKVILLFMEVDSTCNENNHRNPESAIVVENGKQKILNELNTVEEQLTQLLEEASSAIAYIASTSSLTADNTFIDIGAWLRVSSVCTLGAWVLWML